jgi:hypothetical protein
MRRLDLDPQEAGTAADTSPAPLRKAAWAASRMAPGYRREPPTSSTWP